MPMLSGSMSPYLPVGSTLIIASAAGHAVRTGDVVIFRDGERLIAHRVIWGWPPRQPRQFLQAGDGVSRVSWVPARGILGLVVGVRLPDGTARDLRDPAAKRTGARLARRRLLRALRRGFREGGTEHD